MKIEERFQNNAKNRMRNEVSKEETIFFESILEDKHYNKKLKKWKISCHSCISSHHHADELYCAIHEIDEENISNFKKKTKKLALLRTQVNIRIKVLEQDICIIFTRSRKQCPLDEIIKDLSDFISTHGSSNLDIIHNPASLIGKSISHKFEIEESHDEQWYDGDIIDYNDETKTFWDCIWRGRWSLLFWFVHLWVTLWYINCMCVLLHNYHVIHLSLWFPKSESSTI